MSRAFVALLIALLIALTIGAPGAASAQPLWDSEWRDYGVADALATAGFGVLALTTELVGGPQRPRWEREVLLDLPLRRAIGSRRTTGEHRAALVSDITVSVLMAAPFADAAIAGYAVNEDDKFASRYSLFALQTFALTFGTTNLVKVLVGRARPAVAECFARRLSDPEATCDPRPNVSFFSGHSSVSFTGAGLICAFDDLAPQLHPGGFAGQLPCIGALSIAATTALLRIVANKHHLTDVIVGTAVGLVAGWGWPHLRLREGYDPP